MARQQSCGHAQRHTLVAVSTLAILLVSTVESHAQKFVLPPPKDTAEARRFAFFAYDRDLPLNVVLHPKDSNTKRKRTLVSFDSVHDQRVSSILALPTSSKAPYPAIILVHGSGGNKDTSYIQWVSEALVAQGYATLSIDTQYHGDRARTGRNGEIHLPDSYTMRDAWVQSVVDLRRTVDYLLSRPDIDKNKIGYMGFSQGAMLGAVLGGVEERIAAFCLAVPGGGLMQIVQNLDKYPVIKARWPIRITPEKLKVIEEVVDITDPIHYVGRILPRPLLIVVAKHDEIIPPEASIALIEAAGAKEPEHIRRWESGHVLHPNALFDVRNFFTSNFGKRTP